MVSRPIPFDFVLDWLEPVRPLTKPMFGCTAVYVGERIVLILRERGDPPQDDGVWLATVPDFHESLRQDFPTMRSITIFGPGQTGWQVLGADDDEFEPMVRKACHMVVSGDPRIGKVPKPKKRRSMLKKTKSASSMKKRSQKTPSVKSSKPKTR